MDAKERSNGFVDAVRYALDAKESISDKEDIFRWFTPPTGTSGTPFPAKEEKEPKHCLEAFEEYKKSEQERLVKDLEGIRDFLFGAEKYPFERAHYLGQFTVSHTGNGNTFVNDEFASKENLEHLYSKIEAERLKDINSQIEFRKHRMIQGDKGQKEYMEREVKELEEKLVKKEIYFEDRLKYAEDIYAQKEKSLYTKHSEREKQLMERIGEITEVLSKKVDLLNTIDERNNVLRAAMWTSIAINVGLVITHIVRGL